MTGRFVPVARTEDVPAGTGVQVVVDGRPVALFNVDGVFFAVDGTCLHRGGPVGEGDLEGTIVTCPWHGWQYDVTTGRNVFDESIGLAGCAVRVEGGTVLVAMDRDGS